MSAAAPRHRHAARLGFHDLGPLGVARASALLRMLQEAAVEASSALGYDAAWYRAAGTQWLVRRSELAIAALPAGGDTVTVETWVEDFRRVRSRRAYRVSGAAGEIARGWSDWIYVDLAARRPTRAAAEMIAAFLPAAEAAPAVQRTPLAVAVAPDASAHSWTVRLADLDGFGHVNNAAYLDVIEEAAFAAFASAGWPIERWAAAGLAPRVAAVDLEYLAESRLGDVLVCRSSPRAAAGGWTSDVEIDSTTAGETIACGRVAWCCVERASGARAEPPDEILAAARRRGTSSRADGS